MVFLFPIGPESEDLEDAVVEWPWMTGLLMVACIGCYIAFLGAADPKLRTLRVLTWGYNAEKPLGVGLFSYTLLHSDGGHLFGNLAFMCGFSVAVERLLGRLKLLAVWVIAGITSAWFYGLFATKVTLGSGLSFYPPLIGASGAIMGLMGCLLPARPQLRIRMLVGIFRYWKVYPVPAWIICLGYLLKEVTSAVGSPGSSVAYTAHIGGILGGAALAMFLPMIDDKVADLRRGWQVRRASTAKAAPAPAPADAFASVVMHPRKGQAASVSLPREQPEAPVGDPAAELEGKLGAEVLPDSGEIDRPDAVRDVGPPIPDESVHEMVIMVEAPEDEAARLGAVDADAMPVAQDKSWAGSLWEADLQERIRRARAFERKGEKAASAFDFYRKLLEDRGVPSGYRAYAGARMARMLARGGQYKAAVKLAGKLLKNPLPPQLRRHIEESGVYAHKKRKAARAGQGRGRGKELP